MKLDDEANAKAKINTKTKAIAVAGTHSGCGKTTVALGLMAALGKKGLAVQSFKAGPDFIDAGIHGLVTGRSARNLDVWMCGEKYVRESFFRHSNGSESSLVDISVIEGVMGMFDGENNTARLAQLLGVPVVLVVDAYGAAESAAAVVRGFVETGVNDYGVKYAGVIFNRVASKRHFDRIADSVRGIPVLGYLSREANFEISHRHLGLVVAEEAPLNREQIEKLADSIIEGVDVDKLIEMAETVSASTISNEHTLIFTPGAKFSTTPMLAPTTTSTSKSIKIAVALDKAFCFYYEDNLDMLRDCGFEIVPFSPLSDQEIPADITVLYIGGGYPELRAKKLSENVSMLNSIKKWAIDENPVYAECGGLMYLSEAITDLDGVRHPMAGVLPFETRMMKKARLGYREVRLLDDCILGKKNNICRGHEFHYSEIIDKNKEIIENKSKEKEKNKDESRSIYSVTDNRGNVVDNAAGFLYKNTLASYIHVHFGSIGGSIGGGIGLPEFIHNQVDKVAE